MVRIKIDYAKCVKEKDRICVELCPFSVFSFEKAPRPRVVDAESCIMCRVCQVNCPSQAIEILG
jgi:NAD-dependent dihydropyrimidine dehydrogenase PreA subunit